MAAVELTGILMTQRTTCTSAVASSTVLTLERVCVNRFTILCLCISIVVAFYNEAVTSEGVVMGADLLPLASKPQVGYFQTKIHMSETSKGNRAIKTILKSGDVLQLKFHFLIIELHFRINSAKLNRKVCLTIVSTIRFNCDCGSFISLFFSFQTAGCSFKTAVIALNGCHAGGTFSRHKWFGTAWKLTGRLTAARLEK